MAKQFYSMLFSERMNVIDSFVPLNDITFILPEVYTGLKSLQP